MLKEVLVVEGKMDVVAIDKAVDADCIITGGFALHKKTLDDIEKAYKKRGIIILTDPDSAGERIRKFLAKRFPEAKHAFVPVEDATASRPSLTPSVRRSRKSARITSSRPRRSQAPTSSARASRAAQAPRSAARLLAPRSASALRMPRPF